MTVQSKGISLPVETIVIVAIAVLVLVVIVAFFVGGAGTQVSMISEREALSRGCAELAVRGCGTNLSQIFITGYNATCDGLSGNTLEVACCRNGYKIYDYGTPGSCQQVACHCP